MNNQSLIGRVSGCCVNSNLYAPLLCGSSCLLLFFTGDKTRDLNQEEEMKPLPQPNLCNDQGCYSISTGEEAQRSSGAPELPAFFSLAALAEVAAMENVNG